MALHHFIGKLAQLRVTRSPKLITAIVVALGGFGAVAFAVAPLSANGPAPSQRVVSQLVDNPGLSAQLSQLSSQELRLRRTAITRDGDTLASVLRRMGVLDLAAEKSLARDAAVDQALDGSAGAVVQVSTSGDGQLIELLVRFPLEGNPQGRSHFSRLTTSRSGSAWTSRIETVALERVRRFAAATVRSNLKAAALESHVPDSVAAQLAELYSGGSDARREMRQGDAVGVVYEALLADGEPLPWNDSAGRVLAAEFSSGGGPARQVIWFKGEEGAAGYYDAKGRPRRQTFLAAPLDVVNVTSGFEVRMDPILRRAVDHQGVDYAAPLGTPVHAVASGVVEFAGQQTGYGNVIELRHSAERTTLYAHLSKIDVAVGDTVAQGDAVGAVGRTGWATGPHLHFEYRVGGVHQDPQLSTRSTEQAVLGPAARRQFEQVARSAKAELAVAQIVGGRRTSFE
jgi:murein DD-endopeptidase MepM/ murein hydrolase activator NlpD